MGSPFGRSPDVILSAILATYVNRKSPRTTMLNNLRTISIRLAGAIALLVLVACDSARAGVPPQKPTARHRPRANKRPVLAGGCFWGIEAVFKHLKGSDWGYFRIRREVRRNRPTIGRSAAVRQAMPSGQCHLRSVASVLRPDSQVFFAVAHDPTQLNGQGPDIGTQYRSATSMPMKNRSALRRPTSINWGRPRYFRAPWSPR